MTGRDWRTAAGYLGMFMLWLRHAETGGDVVVPGPGMKDEAQRLLGHAAISSTQVYLHPSEERLRVAVERVSIDSQGVDR